MPVTHDAWLVALSLVVAIQGAYVGLSLVVQIGAAAGLRRRVLLAGEADFVAFVGSRKKAAALKEKLVAGGVDPARLAQLKAPAGLDLGAITPEEIAISILAEIVAIRRGGRAGGATAHIAPSPRHRLVATVRFGAARPVPVILVADRECPMPTSIQRASPRFRQLATFSNQFPLSNRRRSS